MHFATDSTFIFLDQVDLVRLGIFLLELGKKHTVNSPLAYHNQKRITRIVEICNSLVKLRSEIKIVAVNCRIHFPRLIIKSAGKIQLLI